MGFRGFGLHITSPDIIENPHFAEWLQVEEFRRIPHSDETIFITNLHLNDGAAYRSELKLCHDDVCSEIETTPEFIILHSAPVAGPWSAVLEADNQTVCWTCHRKLFKTLQCIKALINTVLDHCHNGRVQAARICREGGHQRISVGTATQWWQHCKLDGLQFRQEQKSRLILSKKIL